MHLKRHILLLLFILAVSIYGFSQETVVKSEDKKDPVKVLQENQQQKKADVIKSVPVTNKTMDAIRQQNKRVTLEQMHTINKAMRKSMTVRRRK
jgi:Na+-transporting methylmalonyl-CoA/oxaloacetate decarboxylase gamma subunit